MQHHAKKKLPTPKARIHVPALLIYGFIALQIAIITYFWWHASGHQAMTSQAGMIIAIGRISGLLGALALIFEFVFMSRLPLLEQAFGRAWQAQLHKWNGYAVIGLLTLHLSFLVLGYAMVDKLSLWGQFMSFNNTYEDVLKAFIGYLLLLVIVGLSIYIVRRRMKYETWFIIHLLSYLALLLAFGHQLKVGVDFISQPLFVTYWYALYIATFLLVVTFRFARPLYLSLRHSLVVDRVEVEARGIYSIYLKGRDLDKLKYQGGQYAIWYFLAPQLWWQGHPFSFSSHPSTGQPRITVKNSGDYTAILDKVAPGTPIIMDGAYGIFTAEQSKADKILLVAGGIGMTPLLSMLPDLLERTKDITFLYAVRSEADIAHRDELETMGIRLIIVASDDPNFSGERGVVDAPRLNALVPDAAEREAYLCGPPAMMMAVENALIAVDVHPHYIHTEEFSF